MNHTITETMTPEAREALTEALVRIRALKSRVRELQDNPLTSRHAEPIAIIGGAGRFPGAPDLDAYWQMCCRSESAIVEIPASRFRAPELPTRAGLLDRVDGFDHGFFGLSPAEARMMDPQHRMLLEVSWEALEAARTPPERHAHATGIFTGIMTSDYGDLISTTQTDTYTGPGNVACFSAGRISHLLGLQGPSMCLDTACSSSLVAVHLACQSLRTGEVELALAGGCTLILSQQIMELMTRTGALSPTGESCIFDARANGYVRGEGCAMVVLKRLGDAVRDGDAIWAVIRGSAVNHDGRSSTLTAPSPERQEEVVRQALASAGVDARQIGYVEAHGTGTAIGDPIELDGLTRVLGLAQGCQGRCYIGSGKANTGHLEAAAGVTGLLRAALALRHGVIPPQANFEQLNPRVSLRGSTLQINRELRTWESDGPRYAGVSAFGMSGTNAHAILESAPSRHERAMQRGHIFSGMLAMSARSKDALESLVTAYRAGLEGVDWEDLYRAAASRPALTYRCVVQAEGAAQAKEALDRLDVSGIEPAGEEMATTLVLGDASPLDDAMREKFTRHHARFADSLARSAHVAKEVLGVSLFEEEATLCQRASHVALHLAIVDYLIDAGMRIEAIAGLGDGAFAAGVLAQKWDLHEAFSMLPEGSREDSAHGDEAFPCYLHGDDIDALRSTLRADGFTRHLELGVDASSGHADNLANTLTALYERGQLHRWDRVIGTTARIVSLPPYPWQHHTHWVGDAPETLSRPRWRYEVAWHSFTPEPATQGALVALFGDGSSRTDLVIDELERAGHRVIRVVDTGAVQTPSGAFRLPARDADALYALSRATLQSHRAPIERMIHLPWFGDSRGEARQAVMMAVGQAQEGLDCGQWFVTRGALDAASRERAQSDAPLWGLARAFFFESRARGGIIDLDDAASPQDWLAPCLGPLTTKPLQLRAHAGEFRHACIEPVLDATHDRSPWEFDAAASYLVTGGTGGIGKRFVDWMIARGARHVLVTSRREPTGEVRAWMERARQHGATITWHGADVSDERSMRALFMHIEGLDRPLKGIAHVAGVGSQTSMDRLDARELGRVLAPKLTGGWLLHDLSLNHPLDFFLGFSSISSVLAGQGQGAYAAANLALDALVRHRRTLGLPGHTVRWGLWDGEGIPDEQARERFDMLGLHAMDGERALNMLDAIMTGDRAESIVASIDWTTCIALLDPAGEDHLLDTLGARTTETPAHAQATHRDPAQIEELIITQVAQHVDMRPEALPLDRSLTHLGLDSLGGYALHGILQSAGVTLSIEDMLGASTVAELIASARHSDAPARAEAHPTTSVSEPVTTPARAPGEAFNLKHVEGSKANQWFVNHTPERTGTHRLICFPYAGGNPSVFGGWARHLPDHVELCSLQLPARGARLHEPPVHEMRSLIDALIEAYRELDDTPTSFFGHCFGALMMFELAQRCRQEGLPLPKNLFISAARNPKSYTPAQLAADIEQYSPQPPLQLPELDDDALVDALKEMRFADSVDALDSKEIRRLLLPAVRADFAISNSYFYEETAPFEIPIFAMGGRADGYVTAMQLLSWREHTTAGFGHEYCNGGHYFIGDERDRWIERIVERIEL